MSAGERATRQHIAQTQQNITNYKVWVSATNCDVTAEIVQTCGRKCGVWRMYAVPKNGRRFQIHVGNFHNGNARP